MQFPLVSEHAARLLLLAAMRVGRLRALYDPDQERDERGRWTDVGVGTGYSAVQTKEADSPERWKRLSQELRNSRTAKLQEYWGHNKTIVREEGDKEEGELSRLLVVDTTNAHWTKAPVIGILEYGPHSNEQAGQLEAVVQVHPDHRRKGFATKLYDVAEELTGEHFAPSALQTERAKAFWRARIKRSIRSARLRTLYDPDQERDERGRWTSGSGFDADISDRYPIINEMRGYNERDAKRVRSQLRQKGRLNSDGTVSLYHATLSEESSIKQRGLIPAFETAPGQDWQADHSKYATYFFLDRGHAIDQIEQAGAGLVVEARIPITGSTLSRFVPDEDSSTNIHDGVKTLVEGGAVAFIGGVPPSAIRIVLTRGAEFNPDQPRDESGKWTSGSGFTKLMDDIRQPDGGFTYSPVTQKSPTTGYALSVTRGAEKVLDAKTLSLEDLYQYSETHRAELTKSGNFLGAWHNPADGKIYLDVSTVVQSEQEAARLAFENDQIAYFDLKAGKSVTISSQRKRRAAETNAYSNRFRYTTRADTRRTDRPIQALDRPGSGSGRSGKAAREDRALEFDPNQPRDEVGRWTDTGGGSSSAPVAGSAPHLAEQSAVGVAAGARLLDRAVAEAAYGPVGGVEEWDDLSKDTQVKIYDHWLTNAFDNGVEVDMSGVEREMLNDLRRDNDKIIEETEKQTLSALNGAFPNENPQLPGLEGDNFRQIDPETLTVDSDDGEGAPLVDLDQVRFTDGSELTAEEQSLLVKTWNDKYEEAFEEEAAKIPESNAWYDARNELEIEALNDEWNSLSDIDKLDLAGNFDVDIKAGKTVDPGEPKRWLTGVNKEDLATEDYAKTHAIATKMTELRMSEVLAERGIGQNVDTEAFIGDTWQAWKVSSHSIQSNALQYAAAEELGGVHRLTPAEVLAVRATYEVDGRLDVLKAYARAQWETTQYVMSRAEQHEVDVYRAILIPTKDAKREYYDSSGNKWDESQHPRDAQGLFVKLPETSLLRAGAQSTTATIDVANNWGGTGKHEPGSDRVVLRIRAPRTSILSLPVYGDNEQEEHELVLLGTKDKWTWDLWLGKAPTFQHPTLKVALRALAAKMKRKNRKIVIDLQAADRKLPGHWLKGTNPGLTEAVAKVRRQRGMRGAEFDPDQPRDELGRWTDTGGGRSADRNKVLTSGKVASSEKISGSINAVEKVTLVDDSGRTVDAIFKPTSGEAWTGGDSARRLFVETYGVEPESELGQRVIFGDSDDPAIQHLAAFDPDDYGDFEDDSPVRDSVNNRSFTYAEREAAAYEVDQALGLNVVPPTTTRSVNGKSGMVQEFVQEDANRDLRKINPDSVYGAAILDVAIGNTDRHSGNYLVSNGRFVGIDHGLAFPDSAKEFRPDATVEALSIINNSRMSPDFVSQIKQSLEDTDWEKISDKWNLSSSEEHHFFNRLELLRSAFNEYDSPEDGIKHVLAELAKESSIAGAVPWR